MHVSIACNTSLRLHSLHALDFVVRRLHMHLHAIIVAYDIAGRTSLPCDVDNRPNLRITPIGVTQVLL